MLAVSGATMRRSYGTILNPSPTPAMNSSKILTFRTKATMNTAAIRTGIAVEHAAVDLPLVQQVCHQDPETAANSDVAQIQGRILHGPRRAGCGAERGNIRRDKLDEVAFSTVKITMSLIATARLPLSAFILRIASIPDGVAAFQDQGDLPPIFVVICFLARWSFVRNSRRVIGENSFASASIIPAFPATLLRPTTSNDPDLQAAQSPARRRKAQRPLTGPFLRSQRRPRPPK